MLQNFFQGQQNPKKGSKQVNQPQNRPAAGKVSLSTPPTTGPVYVIDSKATIAEFEQVSSFRNPSVKPEDNGELLAELIATVCTNINYEEIFSYFNIGCLFVIAPSIAQYPHLFSAYFEVCKKKCGVDTALLRRFNTSLKQIKSLQSENSQTFSKTLDGSRQRINDLITTIAQSQSKVRTLPLEEQIKVGDSATSIEVLTKALEALDDTQRQALLKSLSPPLPPSPITGGNP